jgi:cytochrome d ubiquinol oxidase subunit I
MQTPQGFDIIDGRVVPTDWLKVIFNPSFPYRLVHMGLACYLATALFVGATGAWHLLKHRDNPRVRTMFSMAMWMILVTAPLQIFAGDQHGLNTLQYQPAKIAAMEGLWSNTPGQGMPETLLGWPDMDAQKTLDAVEVPHLGSLILTHTWDGQIKALDDFPPQDRPDSTIIFWTFRIMIGLAMLMLLLGLGGAWFRWRGQLYNQRLFLRFATAMGPTGIVAMLAGWITTEVGRQPWVVYGVMRTADAVSHHSAGAMTVSLVLFVVVYCAVFGTGISYLVKVATTEPGRTPIPPDSDDPNRRPSRPLSAAPDIDPSPLTAGE